MYSKRLLYTPATRERAVLREKRKPLVQGRLVCEVSGGMLDPATHSTEVSLRSDWPQSRKMLTSSPVPTCDDCLDNQDKANRPGDSGDVESKKMDPALSRLVDDSCSRDGESAGSAHSTIQQTSAAKREEKQKELPQQSTSYSTYYLQNPNLDEIIGNLRPTRKHNEMLDDTGIIPRHRLTVPDSENPKCCRRLPTLNKSKYGEDSAQGGRSCHKIHKRRNDKGERQHQETEVDVMCAHYLQAVYLESCALRAYRQQEEHIMHELYQMALLVAEKQKQKEQLEERVTCLRHDNKVHDTLHTQETSLAPVVLGLEKLRKQYNTLSSALDSMRHQLPTHGINTHHNMDQFIGQMNVTLTKSEKLMRELSAICSDKRTNTQTSSNQPHASKHTTQCTECQPLLNGVSLQPVEDGSLLRTQDLHISSSW